MILWGPMDCPKVSTMSAAQQFYRLADFQEIGDGTSESPGPDLIFSNTPLESGERLPLY